MEKKFRLLLLLALLLTAATGAWAQEPWTSGDCTVTLSDGVMTVSGTGAMADYEEYNLTPWYGKNVKTIVIESGVTSIGRSAFSGCSKLESVSIPASVTSIGDGAFEDGGSDAAALTVSFAEGSTPLTIGEEAFHYANLKSIDIPNRVTSIGRSAFSGCSKLESVSIPASVTSIGEEAFSYCGMLAKVYIYAPSLTTYGAYAFFENAAGRKIYVLADAVDTYKAGWSNYAADIEAMNLYATSMKDGVKDADKWTITPNPATAGQTVTLQYNGRLKVKGVKATSDAAAAGAKAAKDATAEDLGKVIGADGYIYDNVEAATAAGTAASAIIAYVGTAGSVDESSSTYKGLAIALTDANGGSTCQWYTANSVNCVSKTNAIATAITKMDGIASTNILTDDGHTHAAATAASSYGTARPSGVSAWFLPSMGQWNLIVQGLATKQAGSTVSTDLTTFSNSTYMADNLNSVITAAGGTGFQSSYYWSSTEFKISHAWDVDFGNGYADSNNKTTNSYVRAVFAF